MQFWIFIWVLKNILYDNKQRANLQQPTQKVIVYKSHFYWTEYEIWAGFGAAGSAENFELGL